MRLKIVKRDRYRCVVPGCRRRAQLEDHHLRFRSQGGGNEGTNRATLCHSHHAHGVHKGYVRITGKAPYALRFELGCRKDGPPVLRLIGHRIVERAFEDPVVAESVTFSPGFKRQAGLNYSSGQDAYSSRSTQ